MASTTEKDCEESVNEKDTKYIILNKSTVHTPPHLADISRKLLCIEYPGIVENIDNMLETLGGIRTIEMAVGNYNRRLELRFRPDDIFSKPCWGDKDYNSGILVKITVRQPKVNNSEPSCSKNTASDLERSTTYHYQVIGVPTMTFKFTRLCDFQYLPLVPSTKNENSKTPCRNIYEDIMPSSLPDFKWFELNCSLRWQMYAWANWRAGSVCSIARFLIYGNKIIGMRVEYATKHTLSEESLSMPLFFPPPIFAKFNSSKENKLFYERYKYYEKMIPEVAERLKKESQKKRQEPKNVIGRARSTRRANSIFVNFNFRDTIVPAGPHQEALNAIRKRGLEHGAFLKIKQLFEERPIWSKTALLHKSGVRSDRLKVILPAVSYHFPSGPWRVMWCKFGYDPREDPNSRIYQTFDFRVRASGGLKVKVQAKRNYSSNLMHYRAGPITTEKFSLKDCSADKTKSKPPLDESHYILLPDVLPPARQMFYQYCDLHLPEIQDMLARLPRETKFHPKNGWLPNGFNDQCREIVNKYITVYVRQLLMEEKAKKDEETKLLKEETGNAEEKNVPEHSSPNITILGTPIVIDDDDDDDNALIDSGGEDDIEGHDEMTESDEDDEAMEGDEDIDLEAVEEINKIIGNIGEPEAQTSENVDEKEDSDEEFDPELVKLYRKLIVSNTDM